MSYKIQGAVRRNKRNFIIFAILWVILSIVLVMPIAYSIVNATVNGSFNLGKFFEEIFLAMSNLGTVLTKTFTSEYIGTFLSTLLKFSVVYAIFILIGLIRTAPKNE